MGGQHWVGITVHQNAHAANIRTVDVRTRLVCNAFRFTVCALAETDPGTLVREIFDICLSAVQISLQHRPYPWEVLAQFPQNTESGIGSGVIFHIERDCGSGVGCCLADDSCVIQSNLGSVDTEGLANRRKLD